MYLHLDFMWGREWSILIADHKSAKFSVFYQIILKCFLRAVRNHLMCFKRCKICHANGLADTNCSCLQPLVL